MESNFHQWASSFAPLAIGPDDPISVDKYKKCLQSMRPEVALFITKLVFYGDQRKVLEKVVIPCTIIQTTNDKVAPISVGYYMMKMIKAKSMVENIEAGHFPQLTAHVQFLEVLGRVLGFDL
ncbi:hypothetical protein Acr_21g0000140 [Actinidia rufa]|uniref:Alpha/beta-Hydrolases superfamily protein n=1 Tax=Actinidia rufa TaxID=165716 RepID=A0A7J0GF64_9ERIC|nr:hypothetical protein Acr_21g0000140 [Actinidia rufa]